MTEKKRVLGSDLRKVDAHEITAEEYEEIPELTKEWFEQADLYHAGKLMRRGRPPSKARKEAVSIRLSPEVLSYFRKDGQGWQTRIDETLRAVVKRRSKRA